MPGRLHLVLFHVHVDVPLGDLVAVFILVAIDHPLVLFTGGPPALFSSQFRVPSALKEANDLGVSAWNSWYTSQTFGSCMPCLPPGGIDPGSYLAPDESDDESRRAHLPA